MLNVPIHRYHVWRGFPLVADYATKKVASRSLEITLFEASLKKRFSIFLQPAWGFNRSIERA